DLLRQRGNGWLVRYPIGNHAFDAGMPVSTAFRWDTGIEARVGSEPVSLAAAVTQGTLGNPLFHDHNDGKQGSARPAWKPGPGFELGLSGARGESASRTLQDAIPAGVVGGPYRQRALGADLEVSRAYWLVRAEAIATEWDVPRVAEPFVDSPL